WLTARHHSSPNTRGARPPPQLKRTCGLKWNKRSCARAIAANRNKLAATNIHVIGVQRVRGRGRSSNKRGFGADGNGWISLAAGRFSLVSELSAAGEAAI